MNVSGSYERRNLHPFCTSESLNTPVMANFNYLKNKTKQTELEHSIKKSILGKTYWKTQRHLFQEYQECQQVAMVMKKRKNVY